MRLPQSRTRRSIFLAAVITTSALAVAGCSSTPDSGIADPRVDDASPIDLDFSYASTSPLASVIAAQESGSWVDNGVNVTIQEVPDVGTATDLAIGKQADLAHSAPTTAFAAMSQGVPITVIAGLGFGHGDHQAGFLTSLASSGIKTIEDLRGKTVSVTGIGTSYDFLLRAAIQNAGLDPARDVNIVPIPYPQARGALDQGQVDVAHMLAIDYALLSEQEDVNVVATSAELANAPIEITGVVVARNDWLEQNREAAVRFLAGLVQAEAATSEDVRTNDAQNTIKLLQPILQYDEPTIEAYKTYRLEDIGIEPELHGLLRVPQSFVNPVLEALKKGGGLPGETPVTYDSAVDMSYIEEAYERAGIEWNTDVEFE